MESRPPFFRGNAADSARRYRRFSAERARGIVAAGPGKGFGHLYPSAGSVVCITVFARSPSGEEQLGFATRGEFESRGSQRGRDGEEEPRKLMLRLLKLLYVFGSCKERGSPSDEERRGEWTRGCGGRLFISLEFRKSGNIDPSAAERLGRATSEFSLVARVRE